jgi:hypothetical protein
MRNLGILLQRHRGDAEQQENKKILSFLMVTKTFSNWPLIKNPVLFSWLKLCVCALCTAVTRSLSLAPTEIAALKNFNFLHFAHSLLLGGHT